MPDNDRLASVVDDWIAKAESDLKTAEHCLIMGADAPCDTICFHAQQGVEKYLKAILSYCGAPFGRTHDIELLVRLLPSSLLSDWPVAQQRLLTTYATTTRYPGEYEPISLQEARDAVALAVLIRDQLHQYLAERRR